MARVFSSGFELQSLDSLGKEFTRFGVNGGVNSPGAVSTTIKRSGAAALRINGNIANNNNGIGVGQDTHSGTTNKKLWLRSYVLFEAFPSNTTSVMDICDLDATLGPIPNVMLSISPGGQFQLYYNPNAGYTAISPASSVINLHQWYCCEIFVDTTTATSWSGEFRLNGTTISSFSGLNGGGSFPCKIIRLIAFPFLDTTSPSNGIDQYYDDVAANDANGSVQNSWPGEGSIIHLRPNASGDNNAWLKQGGGAGDINNYQSVNEITPDDVTSYLKRTVSGTPTDDYNCDSSASAGIGATDTIKVIQVGARIGANSNTVTARDAKLRIKGQSGGTVQVGSTQFWNSTTWLTHYVVAPATYSLTSYTNPQNGAAWTPATLDTMQIGMQANTASANEIRITTLWALVDYVPNPVVVHQGNSSLAASVSIISSAILNVALAFANINVTSSLIAIPAQQAVSFASLPIASDLSADTLIYRSASAIIPGTFNLIVDSIPRFLLAVTFNPMSNLVASSRQIWSSVAQLSADSNLLSVTKQNFASLVSLTVASDISVAAVIKYKTVATFDTIVSDLRATGQIKLIGSSAFVLSSSLDVSLTQKIWAATSVLSASATLQLNTIQSFTGIATIAAMSSFFAVGGSAVPAQSNISINSSIIADTRWVQRAIALLTANSSLIAGIDRYISVLPIIPATSSLLADSLRYIPAISAFPISSNLSAFTKVNFSAIATLSCSTDLSVVATQTIKHQGSAQIDCILSCIANARRYTLFDSVWPLSSSLDTKFTPLLQSSFGAVLSGDTTLTAFVVIKDRNISATLLGTSTLLAKAIEIFKAQSSYQLSSDLSLFTLQNWGCKSRIDLTSDLKTSTVQKMVETSKWNLTSKCIAKTLQFGFSRSNFIMISTLSANTIIHQVEDHAKTHKHLRGSLVRRPLRASLGVP